MKLQSPLTSPTDFAKVARAEFKEHECDDKSSADREHVNQSIDSHFSVSLSEPPPSLPLFAYINKGVYHQT